MADERTGSTFTWLNSPLRSRQQVKTLIRTVQIHSWYRHNPSVSRDDTNTRSPYLTKLQQMPPPKKKPTVRWQDMTSTIFGAKRMLELCKLAPKVRCSLAVTHVHASYVTQNCLASLDIHLLTLITSPPPQYLCFTFAIHLSFLS